MTLNISVVQHSHDPQPAPDVHEVQTELHKLGYYLFAIDGAYGDHSRSACVAFQRHVGLVDDGIVGPATLTKLRAATGYKPPTTQSSAGRMADLMYRWVTTGIDGTPPRYLWDGKPSLTDSSPDASDCSGGTSWAIGRTTGHAWIAGSRYQYAGSRHISVDQAIKTKGALLFMSSDGTATGVHHVAVSMGNGMTAECRSAHLTPECGSWDAHRGFNLAGLVPTLVY